MKNYMIAIVSIYLLIMNSCGTKTIKPDGSTPLKGPIQLKLNINNNDSIIPKNFNLKVWFDMPTQIIAADGVPINNITAIEFTKALDCTYIENDSFAYGRKPNFIKGSLEGEKSRASIVFKKGDIHWEDTYVCRDTGVFWFNYVDQAAPMKIWTSDGKFYSILVTLAIDVPDKHINMLLNKAPYLTDYIPYMESLGFGTFCFRVVP